MLNWSLSQKADGWLDGEDFWEGYLTSWALMLVVVGCSR